MTALLISGMGPAFPESSLLADTWFDPRMSEGDRAIEDKSVPDLSELFYMRDGLQVPLLRPRRDGGGARVARTTAGSATETSSPPAKAPHLTTFTLQSILDNASLDYETLDTSVIWAAGEGPSGPFDTVLLSTTFVWDRHTLTRAVEWIEERYGESTLILGGQYSNLKFAWIMSEHPFVEVIVRGDAENSLPRLLRALAGRGREAVGAIPNLVYRDPSNQRLRVTPIEYVDLDSTPSPVPIGEAMTVPYESMRGCPFSCKYCSFPSASPKWRYKSAQKIVDDWVHYQRVNGAQFIKALDSTFTVPPARLRALLPMLIEKEISWEAYSRANSINSRDLVAQLEDAGCKSLFIGFESMNDTVLGYMNKRVKTKSNRIAHELLSESSVKHFGSFIVGYPGETPEMFQDTRDFLVHEYRGEFALYTFLLQDETMPVWEDAEKFGIEVLGDSEDATSWRHNGMTSDDADELRRATIRDVRWRNDHAISRLWQHNYEMPLVPSASVKENFSIEKAVDRLGSVAADFSDASQRIAHVGALRADLFDVGVHSNKVEK
ncbi:radical SAM protein (plasmid) [Rhodococcoides fascians A21d2]|uniref:B12-binding domain-containing radical SAM protein n=1 Tax=Rhodococcoides fascians TaxID=1828 RepID=UPI0013EF2E8C|nr:radical SAM protein [Rhodococcus fascians]QII03666.1 radical SAM protein [Rhodococcus fascians A21d2]